MTSHLIEIHIGPVQDFIAAARRSRDLWFGSWLLSELSKAVAKAIADEAGKEARWQWECQGEVPISFRIGRMLEGNMANGRSRVMHPPSQWTGKGHI